MVICTTTFGSIFVLSFGRGGGGGKWAVLGNIWWWWVGGGWWVVWGKCI